MSRKGFPNKAGEHADTDDILRAELKAAGIPTMQEEAGKPPEYMAETMRSLSGEVKTSVIGCLHGWTFKRAWYYWMAEGPGIENAAAERLHAVHGKEVRVAGHCGCPSPTEWYKGLGVGNYHVDTPDGLKALADTIKALVERATLPTSSERDKGSAPGVGVREGAGSFQARVQPWLVACFEEMIAGDREERNHRFLEEALELVQSCGCTAHEAHQLVDYVYGRPMGEPAQEVGGVMVTLAALCLANGLEMHEAAEVELARIWTKVEAIRAKQAAKPKHSPLPAHAPPTQVPAAPGASVSDGREVFALFMQGHFGGEFPKHPNEAGEYPGWESYWSVFRLGAALSTHGASQQGADMFWDASNPERMGYDLNDIVVERFSDCDGAVGDEFEVQQAKRLPNTRIRITAVPEVGDPEWEEVPAAEGGAS